MACRVPKGIDPMLIQLKGAIVTWWGRVEGLVVSDLLAMRHHPKAAKVAKEPIQVATNRLIGQWRRTRCAIFADQPAHLSKVEELATELRETADGRHVLVHSFWPYGTSSPDEPVKLRSIKPQRADPSILEIKSYPIDPEKLDALNERLIRLYHRLLPMTVNYVIQHSSNPEQLATK